MHSCFLEESICILFTKFPAQVNLQVSDVFFSFFKPNADIA